jgi:hypothetical protein
MNQFRSFISQYASNAVERVACHYKERSLTFRIVASRVLSRVPYLPSSRLNPTCRSQHLPRESQNGTSPSDVFGRGPVLHVVKSSMESTLHCDHRIGPRELKDTEHFLLRCFHSETYAANAVSGRSD